MFGLLGSRAGPAAQPHETPRVRRRPKFHGELDNEESHKSHSNERRVAHEPDVSEVRKVRLERLDKSSRKGTTIPKATSESHVAPDASRSSLSHRRRKHHTSEEKESAAGHSGSKRSTKEEKSRSTYVYGDPKDRDKRRSIIVTETRRRGEEDGSSELGDERHSKQESMDKKSKRKSSIKVVYREPSKASSSSRVKVEERSSSKRSVDVGTSVSRSATHRTKTTAPETVSRPPLSRSATTRIAQPEPGQKLRRNSTSVASTSKQKEKDTASVANSSTSVNTQKARGGFLSSFFASAPPPAPPPPAEPEKQVECLTCSDDVPKSKCAKLQCGHRMCHSCLKRIFKLSVKDPQHMPPKCCTAEHIPLKHVEKLFDVNFKRLWNKKYQEFTTKNRIYCPAKKCGEWIRPAGIHKDNGKKYGICSRCKTKVCAQCNGKWHGSKECPKDEETNKLLETAKQAGWQRCYSCRTMVELKEGCNHMTCRCTAQFCMICGLKWKTCNCPWFNYDTVEEDRLNHMQIPQPVERVNPVPRPVRIRRQRAPTNYNEEMNARRMQEDRDAALARQMHLGIDGADQDSNDIGEVHAIGNAAGHFMNQDYIREASNILASPFNYAANFVVGVTGRRTVTDPPTAPMADRYPAVPQSPREASASASRGASQQAATPLVRRHTTRDAARISSHTRRASDLVVPRRSRTYEAEAAIHAPASRSTSTKKAKAPRPSVLAGLGAADRGNGRVNAWRTHVSPGAPPEAVS